MKALLELDSYFELAKRGFLRWIMMWAKSYVVQLMRYFGAYDRLGIYSGELVLPNDHTLW